jgi:hypothetical protein
MTNTAIWNAALSYSTAMSTELNALASGSFALAASIIDNTTVLNTDGWVSINFPSASTGTGTPSIAIYLLALNGDGTTYGDGTVSGTSIPASGYVGTILLKPSQSSVTLTGSLKIFTDLPPTKFKLGIVNQTGNPLAATGNLVYFASDKFNLNG